MYNFAFEPVATCLSLCRTSHVPLVVEYEDDAKISLDGENRLHKYKGECAIGCLQKYIGGAVVVTEQLSSHLRSPNVLVLPGLVEDVQEGLPSRSASRRPIIVYSGGMNYLKGPDILLDALQYIQQEIEVHFFGGGPMLDVLREQAERVPKHSVNIHGRVPESVLQAYLSQASVFVNPHRMALGHGKSLFPFKVFEYLAAARPVVTSQISEVSPAMEGGLVRYNEDSPEALAEALNLCLSTYSKWSAQALLAAAEVKSQYSVSAVAERIEKVLLAA
jgi:glycosyltransferase involved in cell wall biosynthesis